MPTPFSLYVSTQGRDTWSGRLAEPNRAGTDGPLATIDAARDVLRSLRESGRLPAEGAEVRIRGGVYTREEAFTLCAKDSDTADAPIAYRAYEGEEVHFVGGREITGWTRVKNPAVAWKYQGGVIVPAPEIALTTKVCAGGYFLCALIPLVLLRVEPMSKRLRLEFQVTAAPGDCTGFVRATRFGTHNPSASAEGYAEIIASR